MSARINPAAPAVERLVDLVRDYSGLDFPAGRRTGFDRAVAHALKDHGLGDVSQLYARLSDPTHRSDLEAFTAALTVGETHFFRNRPQIDALRTRVLPDLIRRRTQTQSLRIWSAGCASGEEPYSIAMLLDELLPDPEAWDVTILATDINRIALERAERADYGQWSFRGAPPDLTERYFTREGRRFQLIPRIREMVTFQQLNLVDDTYPSIATGTHAMDLILCRNVLIYFQPETVERVVERLDASLAPGGWLVAGHAESPMPVFRARFTARELPMTVLYEKRDHPVPIVAGTVEPVAGTELAEHAAADPEPAQIAERTLDAAAERFRAGDIEGSLAVLQALAETDPRDARPLSLAARLLASTLQLDDAEHVARLALDRDPLCVGTHYVHGLILEAQNRPKEALEALRRAVYLDPGFALGHYSLASLLAASGEHVRAGRSLDTVIELMAAIPRDQPLPGGDGFTAGRLYDLAESRRRLIAAGGVR